MYINSIPAFKGLITGITGKDSMARTFALNTDKIVQFEAGKRDDSRLTRDRDGYIVKQEIIQPTTTVYFDNKTDRTISYHIDDVIAAYKKASNDPTAVVEITKTK